MAQTSRKPELLIPANSLEVLKIAVIYGADAVYVGGEAYGLRAKARNFSMEELREGIAFAHEHGVRVYVTANILAHNQDLEGVRAYFQELREIKPDALIISDPGVYDIACEICPEIERHISTQANNTNYGSYLFWHRLGAKRVVSARELSLEEIRDERNYGDFYTGRPVQRKYAAKAKDGQGKSSLPDCCFNAEYSRPRPPSFSGKWVPYTS